METLRRFLGLGRPVTAREMKERRRLRREAIWSRPDEPARPGAPLTMLNLAAAAASERQLAAARA